MDSSRPPNTIRGRKLMKRVRGKRCQENEAFDAAE